jgi:hypothetical protein
MAHSRITQRRRLPPSTTWSQSTGLGTLRRVARCDAKPAATTLGDTRSTHVPLTLTVVLPLARHRHC